MPAIKYKPITEAFFLKVRLETLASDLEDAIYLADNISKFAEAPDYKPELEEILYKVKVKLQEVTDGQREMEQGSSST